VSTSKPTRYLWLVVPHLAAILVLNLTVRLAFWQLDRADEKAELLERWERAEAVSVESTPLADLPDLSIVTALGRFDPERHVLLDNQTRNNHPGVHVFSLFTPSNGAAPFLINRGWQPWFRTSGEWPEFETSSAPLEIRGRVTRPPQPGLRLGEALPLDPDSWPNLMTYLELEQVRKVFGERLADRVVLLDPDHPLHLSGDDWPRVNMGPDRHRGYAFQWAAISLAVLVLWVGLTLRYFVFKKRSP
jgi:cytochrome oxidase assembly protein ShyY1